MSPGKARDYGDSFIAHTLVAMIVHGVLLLVLVVLLVMVVPKYKENYRAFGTSLPGFTTLVVDASGPAKRHVALVLLGVAAFMVADAAFLTWLQRNVRPIWSFAWSIVVCALLMLVDIAVVVSLWLPISCLDHIGEAR